ncbi:MAG: NlpC/P60 family protein [Bacteroidales bacterium]|jgi:hypothetical protein|nr:C40 family peptidase [Bacteroidales bacterium]
MSIYGFCNIALIPLRARASHRSEMLTQLLFGEAYEILRFENDWLHIRTLYDDYEGYIDRNQLALIRKSEMETYYQNQLPLSVSSPTLLHDKRRELSFYVYPGSTLPLRDNNSIYLGAEYLVVDALPPQKTMEETLLSFMNAPYLWGGRSPYGIDCSGLNQVVFKIADIQLKRDAFQQAQQGKLVQSIEDARCFDLAFFNNNSGKITHTGIVYKDNTIIHSSGKVRKDKLDKQGIFNVEKEEYTHSLHSIKRFL